MPYSKFQIQYSKFFFFLFLTSIFYILNSTSVFAAEIFIESGIKEIKVGEQVEVNFFIDTENEDINAVEGKIIFPSEFLELKEIRDGGSVINLWIERPKEQPIGNIVFSGITPGGFKNEKGEIVSLVFEAKQEGSGSINISNTSVLKNDGKGGAIKTKISNLEFRVLKSESQIPDSKFKIPIDTAPPESFKPEIAQSPDIFEGKYFLVFTTQDKGSGISSYQVREGVWGKFISAESPYLLQNQKIDKKISVKAIDKEGNERVEIVYPENWSPWYENYWIMGIIVLGIIAIYFLRKILWRKFTK